MRTLPKAALFALIVPAAIAAETNPDVVTVTHAYNRTANRSLDLTVYRPKGWQPSDRRPAIVFWFGGGFWSWNPRQFAQQAEYFAKRGMVAVLADYRVGSRDQTKPPTAFQDARTAFRWLRSNAANEGIDPQRIAAAGGSAGGSLAASLLIEDGLEAPGPRTAISVRPDALILYNPGLGRNVDERTVARFGDLATWRRTAVALSIPPSPPPLLLLYGDKDRLAEGGRRFATDYESAGGRVVLSMTPNVGHGFFNLPPHLGETTRVVDDFLRSLGWLGVTPAVTLPNASAVLAEEPKNPEWAPTRGDRSTNGR